MMQDAGFEDTTKLNFEQFETFMKNYSEEELDLMNETDLNPDRMHD